MKSCFLDRLHCTNPNPYQRGYTLVETLTALLIASTGIAGLSSAVFNAAYTGASAKQSSTIAIAQHSTFTHIRSYFSSLNSAPRSYFFRTDTENATSDLTPLDHNINQLTNTLSHTLSDIHSTVTCQSSDTFTCEVCFEWYEYDQIHRLQNTENTSRSAVNRIDCQLQIV